MARRSSNPRVKGPPAGTALDGGLRLLARRAHSRLELKRKLEGRGYEREAVASALERLTEMGYLDDAAFAAALVRRRSAARGPRALASELAARGIDRAGAAAALSGVDAESELEAATRLVERLYAQKPAPTYQETLNRFGAKLARRGFSSRVVRAACRAVLATTTAG